MKLPVCYEPRSAATVFRETLEAHDYPFTRDSARRDYSRFAIMIPMARAAYVYRYLIEEPEMRVDIWSETPLATGMVTYLELNGGTPAEQRALLAAYAETLPRLPWKFTIGQRLRNGWLSPGLAGARRAWRRALR